MGGPGQGLLEDDGGLEDLVEEATGGSGEWLVIHAMGMYTPVEGCL